MKKRKCSKSLCVNYILLGCVIFVGFLTIVGSNGGGGSGDGLNSNTNAPIIQNIYLYSAVGSVGITTRIAGDIKFIDRNGDIGGGAIYYTYENITYAADLPSSLNGLTNGMFQFDFEAVLSYNTGSMTIPVWIEDAAGNESNIFYTNYTQVWTRQFGSESEESAESVTIDSDGNVYVVGSTQGDMDGNNNIGDFDVCVIKFDASGLKEWTNLIGSTDSDRGMSIAVDSNDNIYITGHTLGDTFDGHASPDPSWDVFLVKYDSSGNKLWTRLLASDEWDEAHGIAIDTNDFVYIVGSTYGDLHGETNNGNYDFFLCKYDLSGTKHWTRLWGSSGSDNGYGITIDNSNNIVLTGSATGNYADVGLVKYNSSGNIQWSTQIGTDCSEWGVGVKADSIGNIYVTGIITGCAIDGENTYYGARDTILIKFDSSGDKVWAKQSGTANYDRGQGVAIDSTDNAYITGYTDSNSFNPGRGDLFITKYNSIGTELWHIQDDTPINVDHGNGISLDSSDYLYIAGHTDDGIDGHTFVGEYDGFIVKYNTDGVRQ